MGFIEQFQGLVVGLDTAPLIYFIERHPDYHRFVRPFFVALSKGQFSVATSTITIVETLVHPIRAGHLELAQRYREILVNAPQISTYDVTPEIAQKAAEIRAKHKIRTPDAIHLATAVFAGANFFLTNDQVLKKFSQIEVLTVEDLA